MGLFSNIKQQLAEQGVKPAPITNPDFHDSSAGDTVTSSVKLTGPEYKLISHDNGVYTYKDLGYGTLENPVVYTGDDPGWHDSRAGDLITSKIQLTGGEYELLGKKDGIYYYGDQGTSSGGVFNKTAEFTGISEFRDLGFKWLPHEMYAAADVLGTVYSPILAGQNMSAILGGRKGVEYSSNTFADLGKSFGISEFNDIPKYMNMYGDITTATIASGAAGPTGGLSLLLIPLRAGLKAGVQEGLYGNVNWSEVGKNALIDTAIAAAGTYIPGGSSLEGAGKAMKIGTDMAKAGTISMAGAKLKGAEWSDAFKSGLISAGSAGAGSLLSTNSAASGAESNSFGVQFAKSNPNYAWMINPKVSAAVLAYGAGKMSGLSDDEALASAAVAAMTTGGELSDKTEAPVSALGQTAAAWKNGRLSIEAKAKLAEVMTQMTGVGFGDNEGKYSLLAKKLDDGFKAFSQSRFAKGVSDVPGRVANAFLPKSAEIPLRTAPGAISEAYKDVPGRVYNAIAPGKKYDVPLKADMYDKSGKLKPEFAQRYDSKGNLLPDAPPLMAPEAVKTSAAGKTSAAAMPKMSYGKELKLSPAAKDTGDKGTFNTPTLDKLTSHAPLIADKYAQPVNYSALDMSKPVPEALPVPVREGKVKPVQIDGGEQYVVGSDVYTHYDGKWFAAPVASMERVADYDAEGTPITTYRPKSDQAKDVKATAFISQEGQWRGQKSFVGNNSPISRKDPPPVLRLDPQQSEQLANVKDSTLFAGTVDKNGDYTWAEVPDGTRASDINKPIGTLNTAPDGTRVLTISTVPMSMGEASLWAAGLVAIPTLGGLYLQKLGMDKADERADEADEENRRLLEEYYNAVSTQVTETESSSSGGGSSVVIPSAWR